MKKKNRPSESLGVVVAVAAIAMLSPSNTRTASPPNLPPAVLTESISSWNSHCNASNSSAGSIAGGCTVAGKTDVTASAYYANGTGTLTVYQSSYSKTEKASASVTSYFEVVGPANSSVPLVFYANGATSQSQSASGSSFGFASAAIETADGRSTLYRAAACSHGFSDCLGNAATAGLPNVFTVQQSFRVAANTVYAIVLNAVGYSNDGAFSAAVDPDVTFDPSFASSRYRYSLVFSADASPAPH
jgi:hypothetical protein